MSTATDASLEYSPEDLLSLPDGKNYELVDGRLVERNMGIESSWVGSQLLARLARFCEDE